MSHNWNPLQDLIVLQDRMNRLFEDATQKRARAGSNASDEFEQADWTPASDVQENETSYLIAMDLPGINRSALEINLEDNRLVVRGNRALEADSQHRRERPRGTFLRAFLVPNAVDQSQISAAYKDGVLEIRLPKRKEKKSERIQINIS